MRQTLIRLGVVVVLVGLFLMAYSIVKPFKAYIENEKPTVSEQQKTTTTGDKNQTEEQKEGAQSVWGTGFVFTILFATLIVIVAISWTGGWRNALVQPTFIAIYAVFVLNSLAYLFAYPMWRWTLNHQILFWGTNIGIVLFVFFFTRPHMRLVAYGIGAFILLGYITTIFYNHDKSSSFDDETKNEFVQIFEVPLGATIEKEVPIGFNLHWGKSEGTFIVENEKGEKARFDPSKDVFESLPWVDKEGNPTFSRRIKFRDLSNKPAKIHLRFSKKS